MSSVGSNAPDSRHLALMQASIAGDEARIRTLIEETAWTSQMDRDALRTALQRVCAVGKLNLALYLIEKGADVETRKEGEVAALFRAAENGRVAVVRALLERGASTECLDRYGRTPLFPAAVKGFVDVVQMLIEKKAKVDAVDQGGRTALLHMAAEKSTEKWTKKHEETAQVLLRAGANVEAADTSRRTSLMWAAGANKIDLARLLLVASDGWRPSRVDAIQNRLRTALHFAAEAGHVELASLLLEHGANPRAASDGGWTPLHNAADRGRSQMIALMLRSGVSVNAQLSNGMTALHWAAFHGHIDVVQLLIDEPNTKLTLRDSFDRTPMLCAAEKGHLHIARILSPARNGSRLSRDAVDACRGFEATVVDFGMDLKEGRQRVFKHSVYDLLYEWDGPSNRARVSTCVENVKHRPSFRWIHLPANNMPWLETLLAKHFIEKGARDLDAYKALEKAFGQEHRGPTTHSYFMRTNCQRMKVHDVQPPPAAVNKPRPAEEKVELKIPQIVEPSTAVPFSAQSTAPAIPGSPNKSATAGTIPEEKKKKRRDKGERGEKITDKLSKKAAADGQSTPTKKQAGQQQTPKQGKKVERPAAKPAIQDNGPHGNLVLFMPFLHYETDESRVQMSEAIRIAKTRPCVKEREDGFLSPVPHARSPDELLVQAYLPMNPPLHIRRTLDQFLYHGIDTAERDQDQVVYRYCRRNKLERKIFMVDQLWLLILSDELIVTAFPQRWKQPKNDPLNVLAGIIEDMNAKTRPPVKSVYDVSMVIASRCSGMFDRHRLESEEYQFLDMFESSIGRVTNRETKLFNRFDRASAAAAKWLKSHRRVGGKRSIFSVRWNNDDSTFQSGDPRFQNALLDIGVETQLLSEIKDIRDELNIILTILNYQHAVLQDFGDHLTDELGRKTDAGWDITKRSREQSRIIETHLADIKRMDGQALNIYSGLTNLLDLKQKHASAFEARFARDQAALTARQGQTILIFTLTTILFLPMSFIAAFFAINIAEFPRDSSSPDNDNGGSLPLSYVCKYMFGIGLGISIPLIACALAIDDLAVLWQMLKGWLGGGKQKEGKTDKSKKHKGMEISSAPAVGRLDDSWLDDPQNHTSTPPTRSLLTYFRRGNHPSHTDRNPTHYARRGRHNQNAEKLSVYAESEREFSPGFGSLGGDTARGAERGGAESNRYARATTRRRLSRSRSRDRDRDRDRDRSRSRSLATTQRSSWLPSRRSVEPALRISFADDVERGRG